MTSLLHPVCRAHPAVERNDECLYVNLNKQLLSINESIRASVSCVSVDLLEELAIPFTSHVFMLICLCVGEDMKQRPRSEAVKSRFLLSSTKHPHSLNRAAGTTWTFQVFSRMMSIQDGQ